MKKRLINISLLALACGGLSVGAAQLFTHKAEAKSVRAETLPTAITIDAGFFSNWDAAAGTFGDQNSTFWGENYNFNAMGTFFRGELNEGWTGVLRSNTWRQQTKYVYFTWSAQDNCDHVNLVFHYGTYTSTPLKNNAFVGNTMMLWYFEIPDEEYASFNGEVFDMSVDLVDDDTTQTGAYRFNNFGFLHVNQSKEQVADAMRLYLNRLNIHNDGNADHALWSKNKRAEIYGHYHTNAHLNKIFLSTDLDNVDEDFEDNSTFLNHWYFDWSYDNNDLTPKHFDTVISTFDYRPDGGTNMPFNKTGNGYFKGWYAGNTNNSGFTETDGAIYRFVSRPFVLSGTGLVSVKMAGRSASLHVLQGTHVHDDLAWADVRSYNGDGDVSNIATGLNTCTMVRHVINLEEYLGQTIQLAIADVFNSGWAASYFDELVTKYTSAPSYNVDVVEQTSNTGHFYATYLDKFVCSTHVDTDPNGVKYKDATTSRVDQSDSYAAYKFVKNYHENLRGSDKNTRACNANKETIQTLYNEFSALTAGAQTIANGSDDFERLGATSENWTTINPTMSNLGTNFAYLVSYYGVGPVNNQSQLLFNISENEPVTMGFIIVGVFVIIAFASIIIVRKRRQNNY